MNPFHYIAIDVDGTLLDDQDHYDSQRLNQDVALLKQRGVAFIVASGNSYDALQSIFNNCPAVDTFVAENGGRIIANGHENYTHPHSKGTIALLLNELQGLSRQPDLLSVSGATQTYIASQYRKVAVPYYPHHSYFATLADVKEPIYNLNLSWFSQRPPVSWIQDLAQKLNQRFPAINATYSGAYGIDILPAGVNKAISLRKLIVDELGGQLAETVAFGDTSNDIKMITEAGCGYAMKNATPDLLAVADRVTAHDNNHNGLLTTIEQLFHL